MWLKYVDQNRTVSRLQARYYILISYLIYLNILRKILFYLIIALENKQQKRPRSTLALSNEH